MDELFLPHLQRNNQPPNVICIYSTDKFEFEPLRDYMLKLNRTVPRLSSKIVKLIGRCYYQRMDDNEWEAKKNDTIELVTGIHSVPELEKYCQQMIMKEFDIENSFSYKYLLIPDWSPTESRVLFLASHLMMDGVSLVSMFLTMSPEVDFSNGPKLAPPSFASKILYELMTPFSLVKLGIEYLSYPRERSCVNMADHPSNEREIRMLEDIPLQPILKKSKQHKTTVNAVVQAVLSQALKEYFSRYGNPKTEEVIFTSTFSLRQFPTSLKEFRMYNGWVPLTYVFPLRDKFENAVVETRKLQKKLAGSSSTIAAKYLANITTSLPFGLGYYIVEYFTKPV